MIKSFKHKGLKLFFETGSKKGIIPDHADKLARILDRLDASVSPGDMNLPAYKLHKMIGKEERTWWVWVNGNWRVTFRFEGKDSVLVDYRDYH
jgi:toxin HigB-1